MAGKRSATSELNHLNWDVDEESEEAGTFRRASDNVLKQRVIKTAKRRNPVPTGQSEGDSGAKGNIFGSFVGFSKTPANPSSAFSFLDPSATKTSNMFKDAPPKESNGSEKVDKDSTNDEYLAKLKGLNESVSNWIKKHVDENPFINLTPIFKDYERYFQEIDKIVVVKPISDSTKKELSTFSFKAPELPKEDTNKPKFSFTSHTIKPANSTSSEGEKTPPPQFSFGMKPKANDESTKIPQTGFTFGSAMATPLSTGTAAASGFTFGSSSLQSSTPFSFNSSTIVPPKPTNSNEDKDVVNVDDDEPPQNDFKPVIEDGNVYTIRCKVFVKKDGNFSDRGVGNLFLKPVPGSEKMQLIVRADTNLGNLLCNFILSDGIPMQRMGKKDVMLVCLPTPDSKPPPIPILLRVKSSDEADDLLKVLEKHKK